jgi:hypothetical protein
LQMCMGSIVSCLLLFRAPVCGKTHHKLTWLFLKNPPRIRPGDGVTPHDPRQTTFLPSRVQAHH